MWFNIYVSDAAPAAPAVAGGPAAEKHYQARHFGKCRVKGCRRRMVIEDGAGDGKVFETPDGYGSWTLRVEQQGKARTWSWPVYFVGGADWGRDMRAAGLVCPDHPTMIMDFKRLLGKYKPEKACDGRCMGAVGPACDCSCGGENHGRSRV